MLAMTRIECTAKSTNKKIEIGGGELRVPKYGTYARTANEIARVSDQAFQRT